MCWRRDSHSVAAVVVVVVVVVVETAVAAEAAAWSARQRDHRSASVQMPGPES